jgi:hypothetical protein
MDVFWQTYPVFKIVELTTGETNTTVPMLTSLSIIGDDIVSNLTFERDRYDYNVVVSSVGSVIIAATPDAGATVHGEGVKVLEKDSTFKVYVIKGSDTTSTYNITIHCQSTDAYLASLTVTAAGAELPLIFSKTKYEYTVEVNNKVSSIRIDAVAVNDGFAGVDGIGIKEIGDKDTTFYIEVTPETGDPKIYTLHVNHTITGILTSRAALQVSPNPTSGIVNIDNPADDEVLVYNVGGTLLLRTRGTSIDLADYPSGAYVIAVGDKTAKVIKL